MLKKSVSTLGLLCLLSTFALSQTDFKPGYIITNDNDTIYGEIDLRSNSKNANTCKFKASPTDDTQSFTTADIKGYRIGEEKPYVSKQITIENQSKDVFLEYLVDGIVDLYYYKNAYSENYFIEKDNILQQLTNEDVLFENEYGDKYLKESKRYVGVLSYLFNDSPEIVEKVQSTGFDYNSLIKITKDYHNQVCNEYECIDFSKTMKSKIMMEVCSGMISSKMGLHSSPDYASNTNPFAGINFRFLPSRNHYLWNIILGINFSKNDFSADYNNTLYDNREKIFRIKAKYPVLRIPVILEYSFPSRKIQPFLYAGYNNVIIINPEYSIERVKEIGAPIPSESKFRTYQYGLTGGFGFRYKLQNGNNIFLKSEYEYRIPSTNSREKLDYHHVKSIFINFGYSFYVN